MDTLGDVDEETWLDPPVLTREQDAVIVTWRGNSPLWPAKQIALRAWEDGFSYGYRVEGEGAIDRAHFFRTRATASAGRDARLFDPEPNSGAVRYTGDHCPPGQRCLMCVPTPSLARRVHRPARLHD